MAELPQVKEVQRQFLAAVAGVRPRLHRFCARMVRSALDGEDLVQETLAQAFFYLPSLEDPARLEPWLFRIAHRKCIDFLRAEPRTSSPYDEARDTRPAPAEVDVAPIGETLAPLVGQLPPMERAAVILKDLLDYRLEEVAEVVDSSLGGVKSALHRGRGKLRAWHERSAGALASGRPEPRPDVALDAAQRARLQAFVDCFNRHDWSALESLVAEDARLEVIDRVPGKRLDASYRTNYAALPWQWRLSLALVDDELVVVHWRRDAAGGPDGPWRAHAAIRLWWHGGKVVRLRDYVHVGYVLDGARLVPTP